MKQQYNVGIYVRLSKDDDREGESLSIENQKLMLQDYVIKQGWQIYDTYIDDGYSGTNFDRPNVKRMIEDVERGKINLVICKDLSRFGRNYILIGQYLDYVFPLHNTRFIALNDNVDTIDRNSTSMDMLPIMNVFNEMYAKDCSRKIKAVIAANAKAGKYRAVKAPYGYIKGTCEKKLPVIDEPAAAIVRRIFELRAEALSPKHIADMLNAEKVPIPSDYEAARTGKPNPRKTNHFWCKDGIKRILSNQLYVGDLVQLKTTVLSHKNKKIVERDKSEWVIIPNTHEAIINRELWEKIREIEASVSIGKRTKQGVTHSLSGLMFCTDCGYKMRIGTNNTTNGSKKNPRIYFRQNYNCGNYIRSGRFACKSHYINLKDINSIILDNIRSKASLVISDEAKARKMFIKSKAEITDKQLEHHGKELFKNEKRLGELETLIKSAYEDKVIRKIPESVCLKLLSTYQTEHTVVAERIIELKTFIERVSRDEQDVDEFIRRIRQYAKLEELDRVTALELIEYVKIGARDVEVREIDIFYKFLGKFEV